MRFITDQDVYKITIDALKQSGHDVLTARELGMSRSSDSDIETSEKFIRRCHCDPDVSREKQSRFSQRFMSLLRHFIPRKDHYSTFGATPYKGKSIAKVLIEFQFIFH